MVRVDVTVPSDIKLIDRRTCNRVTLLLVVPPSVEATGSTRLIANIRNCWIAV